MKIDSTPGEDLALPPLPEPNADYFGYKYTPAETQAYALTAVLAERERCAKLCEQLCVSDYDDYGNSVCAAAIRASR